jgi:lipopolysaccharide/colanic/teichoic acid biosynthesis glycosyltransferase
MTIEVVNAGRVKPLTAHTTELLADSPASSPRTPLSESRLPAGEALSASEFRRRLARDRERAERNQHPCLVLVFSIDNGSVSRRQAAKLLTVVSRYFAAEHAIAWISRRHLGLIPSGVVEQDARRIALAISRRSMVETSVRLDWDVYSYPGNWFYQQSHSSDVRRGPRFPATDSRQTRTDGSYSLGNGAGDFQQQAPSSACCRESGWSVRGMSSEIVGHHLFQTAPLWKRTLDVAVSCLALLLFAPFMLGVAAWIKVSSPGPVLFKQVRWGCLGVPFTIWKFRTMKTDVDQAKHHRYVTALLHSKGTLDKLDAHSELIPCGGFLRKTGIDELPQLFNVLRGEMSLVGPRPDVIAVEAYCPKDARRFEVLPGMTGLWQVSGKNLRTFEEMLALDTTYAQNRSFLLDLKILLKTPSVLIRQLCEKNTAF